jgi:hypothetical protein
MGVAAACSTAACSKMVAASKRGCSFGVSALTALTFLAIDHSDTHNKNAATDRQPSPHGTDVPMADFNVPLSVCEMGANPLNLLSSPCSPFEGGAFDIDVDGNVNVLDDGRRLMERTYQMRTKKKLTT